MLDIEIQKLAEDINKAVQLDRPEATPITMDQLQDIAGVISMSDDVFDRFMDLVNSVE